MKNVCVITGGGSGIGFAIAKQMGRSHEIIISGRNLEKLKSAAEELYSLDIEVNIFKCDISNKKSVQEFADYCKNKGDIKTLINSAGISPNSGNMEMLFNTNALGTIYINEAFSKIIKPGGCIINVASMSAYLLPYLLPKEMISNIDYSLSINDLESFKNKIFSEISTLPENLRDKAAYAISKDFVIWYSTQYACICSKDGIRVLSISPGTFDTPMGQLEGEHASSFAINGALGRVGKPEEIATLFEFCASPGASYLTGTDILCDGGSISAMKRAISLK